MGNLKLYHKTKRESKELDTCSLCKTAEHSCQIKPEFVPNLEKIICGLPCYGHVRHEQKTDYWYILLPPEWQNKQQILAKLCKDQFDNEAVSKKSKELAKEWNLLVNESQMNIDWVSPTSLAGLHITLGRTEEITSNGNYFTFKEGDRVDFKLGNVVAFPTTREKPINMDGQYTDKFGYRYYAVLWILLDIEFISFNFVPKYPPHISLAIIGTKLNVNMVEKFNKKK